MVKGLTWTPHIYLHRRFSLLAGAQTPMHPFSFANSGLKGCSVSALRRVGRGSWVELELTHF